MNRPPSQHESALHVQAPGKVVLWGEYAVLAGAPALVMAVDRYAACTISPGSRDWQFVPHGFTAQPATVERSRLLAAEPPDRAAGWFAVWHVLRSLDAGGIPAGGVVDLDTRGLHHRGTKLGLGSSAAVAVAIYAAFSALLEQKPDPATAQRIHSAIQGGRGSGIDVAAAYFGGLLRFERPDREHRADDAIDPDSGAAAGRIAGQAPQPWRLPAELHHGFVWTGHAASTLDHLQRFERWREDSDDAPLTALSDSARALFAQPPTLSCLRNYIRCLKALDAAAGLGIYSDSHRRLDQLAIASGVVYKPCGAGGGDLGVAFADDPDALQAFLALATDNQFTPIALETAPHGIQIIR